MSRELVVVCRLCSGVVYKRVAAARHVPVACVRVNVIAIYRRGGEEVPIHSSGTSIHRADERNEETPLGVSVNEQGEAEIGAPMGVLCAISETGLTPVGGSHVDVC
jgi:hypothetical protein